ncbi:MAG TPA: histidine phosphatase family protein [Acidimicrobiales bacterium]|nr:histidine phosphatase family protein [Acidimicrobiales bacterium]
MAKRILLVRHGESIWNAAGRWQGAADPPLSDAGRAQARALASAVLHEGIDSIVSSDLDRARETGRIVAAALTLPAPSVDERWRERDVGEVSGHTRDEIEAKWPGLLEQWRRGELEAMPGGETDITSRVVAALEAVATSPDGACTLVVSHGGVIGAVDRWIGNPYLRVGNVQGRWLAVDDDGLISMAGVFSAAEDDDEAPVAL